MLTPYNPFDSKDFYEQYYNAQTGEGLAVYRGKTIMDGSGLGSILKGFARSVAPTLKRASKSIGKRLLATGVNLASDALAGEDFGESARKRFRATGQDLLGAASASLMNTNSIPKRRTGKVTKRKNTNRQQIGKGDIFS